MKLDHLSLRKIIKFVATRCQILRLKCTKFNFGWGPTPDSADELKMQNYVKRGHVGSRDSLLGFWDPISGTVEARNFKFGTEMDGSYY